MARRKELGSLANGLLNSFNSRNNDIDGYWGIGKLYELANEYQVQTITLNLLSEETLPEAEMLENVARIYTRTLVSLVEAYGGCITWIQAAEISLSFNSDNSGSLRADSHGSNISPTAEDDSSGSPYLCCCRIVDDQGKSYVATASGRCWPHDPKRERRR